MGVKVTDRDYKNQYTAFSSSQNWLFGNVGDWQQILVDLDVSTIYSGSLSNTVTFNKDSLTAVLNSGESWGDYGFDIGDEVFIKYTGGLDTTGDGKIDSYLPVTFTFNITNVFDSILEMDSYPFPVGVSEPVELTLPYERGYENATAFYLFSNKVPEGLKFTYNQFSNEDIDNSPMASIIDGAVSSFSFSGLADLGLGVWSDMEANGLQSGMAIDRVAVYHVGDNSPGVGEILINYYRVRAEYMMGIFFDTFTGLQNLELPDKIAEQGSLADNYEITFFPKFNNPNTILTNNKALTKRLGNTGWFNENFNALRSDFVVDSIVYKDSLGGVRDSIDYVSETKVEIEISIPAAEFFTGFDSFTLGFGYAPINEDDYQDKETPYHQNLFVNTGYKYSGAFQINDNSGATVFEGSGIDGASMDYFATTGILITLVNAYTVKIEATMKPNAAFGTLFDSKDEDDRNYFLWMSCVSNTISVSPDSNLSNRVSVLVDINTLVKEIEPSGEYPGMTNSFIEHGSDENSVGVSTYTGFIEDDVLNRTKFTIPKINESFFQSISFDHLVRNDVSGSEYVLNTFTANLSSFPKDGNGIQQIQFDSTRGYFLLEGDNKNWIKVERDEANDTINDYAYIAYFGNRIRWESWILREDVPTEFYNPSLENNGEHNNWLDYLRALPDTHSFHFKVSTLVTEIATLALYENYFPLTFNGYDENVNIDTLHQYFRNSDNSILTEPTILQNEYTRIEITFTNNSGDFIPSETYAEFRLYDPQGAGITQAHNLSSVEDANPESALIPISGQTKLKMDFTASNIVKASCLIDASKMPDLANYVITGRIGEKASTVVCPNPGGIGSMAIGIDFCVS